MNWWFTEPANKELGVIEMAEDHQLSVLIDLRGMTGRMQRLLRHAMNLVAIGLHARDGVTNDTLSIPDVTMHHQFDTSNQWNVEQAQEAWETWILKNGFRDVSEALAGVLEEAQSVLSYWQISLIQNDRKVIGEDWNEIVVHRGQQFHRKTLPQKLDFLKAKHDFELDPHLVKQALSINAARNCLVHRGGLVSDSDIDSSGGLIVEWRCLALVAEIDGEMQEIIPPHYLEAGTRLGISMRNRSRRFEVGDLFQVNTEEFTQICWTLFAFTLSCTQSLQKWAEARGFDFKADDA